MIGFKQTAMVALMAAGLAVGNTAQAELLYNITNLGTLPGGGYSYGAGINSSGHVTGNAETANGSVHAFVTDSSGAIIDLGTLGGNDSYGQGINANGQVTGYSYKTDGYYHAFITNSNGEMNDLGTFVSGNNSAGVSINNSGQVAGTSESSFANYAFVTSLSGQMTALPGLIGVSGINDSAQVVGSLYVGDNFSNARYHAAITNSAGEIIDVGLSGGSNSEGRAINSLGQVTGAVGSMPNYSPNHAFVTTLSGQMIDLGTLGGSGSGGMGINTFGQVVGGANTADDKAHAFVTDNGIMKDLNTLLVTSAAGWELNYAAGINDAGQITGSGTYYGVTRAFLLTPTVVPVPAAAWLFGSGLGLISITRRKK